MAKLNEITDENFKKEVLENPKPYVVTHSALSYCEPCRMLHKILTNHYTQYPEQYQMTSSYSPVVPLSPQPIHSPQKRRCLIHSECKSSKISCI